MAPSPPPSSPRSQRRAAFARALHFARVRACPPPPSPPPPPPPLSLQARWEAAVEKFRQGIIAGRAALDRAKRFGEFPYPHEFNEDVPALAAAALRAAQPPPAPPGTTQRAWERSLRSAYSYERTLERLRQRDAAYVLVERSLETRAAALAEMERSGGPGGWGPDDDNCRPFVLPRR